MLARPVLPGRTYLLTRRCRDRRFFLRPGDLVNQIFLYALAEAARKSGILIHAFIAMSDHIHVIATDLRQDRPDFMHALDLQVSKSVGAEVASWGGFWESGTYSAVELLDPESIVEKIVYTLTNAVAAGLVRRATRWPGATSAVMYFGTSLTIPRPDCRYYRNSGQPEKTVLRLTEPPGFDPIELQILLKRRIREVEKAKRAAMRTANRKFIGPNRVLRQDPHDTAASWEKRRGRNPTFASRDKWKRIEAAQRKRDWLHAYRAALGEFRRGVRDVVFPHGTWAMTRLYRCNCAPSPS